MQIFALNTSIESLLVILALMLLSAVTNWFQKRRQSREEQSWPGPEQLPPARTTEGKAANPPQSPPSARRNWEEELRRLLEGDEPAAPVGPPPLPKPTVVVSTPPRSVPPPPVAQPAFDEEGIPAPTLARLDESRESRRRAQEAEARALEKLRHRAALADSSRAYQQAANLQDRVAEHLKRTPRATGRHVEQQRGSKGFAPQVESALTLLRQKNGARQAFIASLVFGPPKAFELEHHAH